MKDYPLTFVQNILNTISSISTNIYNLDVYGTAEINEELILKRYLYQLKQDVDFYRGEDKDDAAIISKLPPLPLLNQITAWSFFSKAKSVFTHDENEIDPFYDKLLAAFIADIRTQHKIGRVIDDFQADLAKNLDANEFQISEINLEMIQFYCNVFPKKNQEVIEYALMPISEFVLSTEDSKTIAFDRWNDLKKELALRFTNIKELLKEKNRDQQRVTIRSQPPIKKLFQLFLLFNKISAILSFSTTVGGTFGGGSDKNHVIKISLDQKSSFQITSAANDIEIKDLMSSIFDNKVAYAWSAIEKDKTSIKSTVIDSDGKIAAGPFKINSDKSLKNTLIGIANFNKLDDTYVVPYRDNDFNENHFAFVSTKPQQGDLGFDHYNENNINIGTKVSSISNAKDDFCNAHLTHNSGILNFFQGVTQGQYNPIVHGFHSATVSLEGNYLRLDAIDCNLPGMVVSERNTKKSDDNTLQAVINNPDWNPDYDDGMIEQSNSEPRSISQQYNWVSLNTAGLRGFETDHVYPMTAGTISFGDIENEKVINLVAGCMSNATNICLHTYVSEGVLVHQNTINSFPWSPESGLASGFDIDSRNLFVAYAGNTSVWLETYGYDQVNSYQPIEIDSQPGCDYSNVNLQVVQASSILKSDWIAASFIRHNCDNRDLNGAFGVIFSIDNSSRNIGRSAVEALIGIASFTVLALGTISVMYKKLVLERRQFDSFLNEDPSQFINSLLLFLAPINQNQIDIDLESGPNPITNDFNHDDKSDESSSLLQGNKKQRHEQTQKLLFFVKTNQNENLGAYKRLLKDIKIQSILSQYWNLSLQEIKNNMVQFSNNNQRDNTTKKVHRLFKLLAEYKLHHAHRLSIFPVEPDPNFKVSKAIFNDPEINKLLPAYEYQLPAENKKHETYYINWNTILKFLLKSIIKSNDLNKLIQLGWVNKAFHHVVTNIFSEILKTTTTSVDTFTAKLNELAQNPNAQEDDKNQLTSKIEFMYTKTVQYEGLFANMEDCENKFKQPINPADRGTFSFQL